MLDSAIQLTFEACLKAFREGDGPAMEACFAPEAVGFVSSAGPLIGGAAFASTMVALKKRLPTLLVESLRTYGEGPEMAARLKLHIDGKETEGVWAFRFDESGRITRLITLWELADFFGGDRAQMDPATKTQVDAYFRTYNADDEDGHMALVSPKLTYFGAVSRMTADGIETARGVFRSAHDFMGLMRFDVLHIFGTGPDLAVLVGIHGSGKDGRMEQGIWVFHFDADHRFDRVSVLWNPGAFLSRPGAPH